MMMHLDNHLLECRAMAVGRSLNMGEGELGQVVIQGILTKVFATMLDRIWGRGAIAPWFRRPLDHKCFRLPPFAEIALMHHLDLVSLVCKYLLNR